MFTLSLIYIVFYLFVFLAILAISFSQIPIFILTNFSTSNFMVFLQKYKPTKSLYLWLFFCLTGLPPVGLFVVKFNIFFFVLYQTHIFTVIILFLFFFFNMIYYLQLFNFRNFKKPIYQLITPKVFNLWHNTHFNKTYITTYNTYSITLFTVNVLLFLVLTILFFSDYFLVLNIV